MAAMPNTSNPPLIEVLRPGVHTDAKGVRVTLTEADLQAIAEGYSPELHEAPFVVGHPKMDGPAYGWAARFVYRDGVLLAEGHQVEEQFANLVNEGRFKKTSLALYGPKAPGNPKPGIWYPRHVGCLGAMPPAIKGLKSVQFNEAEDGVHEFGDYAESFFVSTLRRLREFLLRTHGKDAADEVVASWELDNVAASITADQVRDSMTSEGTSPAFSEAAQPAGGGADDMSGQQVAELQGQLEAERNRAARAEQELAERRAADEKAAADRRQAEAVAFAEELISTARLPAEQREALVALHMNLAAPSADGQVLTFGEGDDSKPLTQVLADILNLTKPSVEFGERATLQGRDIGQLDDVDAQVQFGEGTSVDPERLALHQDAVRYQREQKARGNEVDYLTAVRAVKK